MMTIFPSHGPEYARDQVGLEALSCHQEQGAGGSNARRRVMDTLGVRAKYHSVVVDELVGAEWTREEMQSRLSPMSPAPIPQTEKNFFFFPEPAGLHPTVNGPWLWSQAIGNTTLPFCPYNELLPPKSMRSIQILNQLESLFLK